LTLENRELRKATIHGFIWRFAERILAQGVSFVVTVILARLLMPSDYAAISLIAVFITIADIFISDGFCAALIQKKDIEDEDYYTVLWGGLVLSGALYFIIFLIAPFVADFYDMPILAPALRVLAIRLIIAAVNSVETAYLSRQLEFKKFFWATFGGTVGSAVVGISMAYAGMGVWSLIAQSLFNYTVDTIILAFMIKKPRLYFSMKRMKSLFNFGYKILLTNLLFTFVDQLRTLVIGKVYSSDDLAFYEKGKQFPQLFSTTICSPLSAVCFPAMAKIQGDINAVKGFLRKGTQLTSYLVTAMVLGLAAVSRSAVLLFLTEKWLPCVPYIWLGAIYYIFPPIHSFNIEAVKAIGRGDQVLKYGLIKRAVSVGTLLVTVWINVEAIACGLIASALIATCLNAYQNKKLFGYTYKEQISDLVPNIALSVVMCIIVYLIGKWLTLPLILTLFVQVISGVFIIALLSIITKNQCFRYIIGMIKNR